MEKNKETGRLVLWWDSEGFPHLEEVLEEYQPKKKSLLQRFKELLARAKGEPMPWDGEVEVMPWEDGKK